ncbi:MULTISPECIES: MarR family winged helix-turn-helix transcriptional regulator [unclassified Dietzia]|uniref:MarR family winged helix-turn-helix transcriptional regulator n=1 Tax=unclassified Dietzia TaxID=2617939 RepID=UPI000D20AFAC|nr:MULTISPECIES: MarR family transcriptional regulator [unclassified Dietzia]AVZ39249.1 MarR family transcriptional regulator [Dietzia sp. JS16-p6b]MBB1022875.1 MarR family transcriptional regulator [Dietzia sp. DQ12-76]MBB1026252.1 MarR family transcriptional regulator [Dietzia sp. DQ11-38-2]QGW24485.1 putative marR-family transcriptional regulator [Dietzia sp. DQ12-45-1b]
MAIDAEQGGKLVVDLSRVVKMLRALNASAPRLHDSLEPSTHPLLFAIHDEPDRVTALAERVHTDISVVSRQVRHLEALGLVAKVPDPDDGRASVVTLSAEGRELVTRVLDGRGQWMADVLADWTPEQAASLDRGLSRLADSLRSELDALTSAKENR